MAAHLADLLHLDNHLLLADRVLLPDSQPILGDTLGPLPLLGFPPQTPILILTDPIRQGVLLLLQHLDLILQPNNLIDVLLLLLGVALLDLPDMFI